MRASCPSSLTDGLRHSNQVLPVTQAAPDLAGTQPGGKAAERTVGHPVRVRPNHHPTRPHETFLDHHLVAHAPVIEVGDVLLLDEAHDLLLFFAASRLGAG